MLIFTHVATSTMASKVANTDINIHVILLANMMVATRAVIWLSVIFASCCSSCCIFLLSPIQ